MSLGSATFACRQKNVKPSSQAHQKYHFLQSKLQIREDFPNVCKRGWICLHKESHFTVRRQSVGPRSQLTIPSFLWNSCPGSLAHFRASSIAMAFEIMICAIAFLLSPLTVLTEPSESNASYVPDAIGFPASLFRDIIKNGEQSVQTQHGGGDIHEFRVSLSQSNSRIREVEITFDNASEATSETFVTEPGDYKVWEVRALAFYPAHGQPFHAGDIRLNLIEALAVLQSKNYHYPWAFVNINKLERYTHPFTPGEAIWSFVDTSSQTREVVCRLGDSSQQVKCLHIPSTIGNATKVS